MPVPYLDHQPHCDGLGSKSQWGSSMSVKKKYMTIIGLASINYRVGSDITALSSTYNLDAQPCRSSE